jgi:deoxyribodipyrimidine photolyase-related protein
MTGTTIIFPHQLFKINPAVKKDTPVYLVEEFLFFRQYHFHKQKLILHRASMKAYADYLGKNKNKVTYIEAQNEIADIRLLVPYLKKKGIDIIYYTDPVDYWIEKRITEAAKKNKINLIKFASPNFMNRMEDIEKYFDNKKTYFQTDFYIWQRKQRKLLLDSNDTPLGGKWSYDSENRLKFPKNENIPVIQSTVENKYVKEAKKYVTKNFNTHYGNTETFFYPVDFSEAENWLDNFLQTRFIKFGPYEDAMVKDESFLYHSVLTPMLNIGLLAPGDIIEKALKAAKKFKVPLNSLEGFIRQITGWREFIRIVYEREGNKQRTKNFWGFSRKIPASFWSGKTGIHPVDNVIGRLLKTGYTHHIERLMVLGNFMLLCEFDPDEVYRWFMEMYIDSYDWVMVPNTYGMTQFADGGLMTSKPYISGSNYLMKMGNWEKGKWQQTWDGLFWRFMHVHRDFFTKNPRLGMLVNMFDKMSAEKRNNHLKIAEEYLASLDQ